MDMKEFCEQYVKMMGGRPFNRLTSNQIHRVVVEGMMPEGSFFTDDQLRGLLNGTRSMVLIDGKRTTVPYTDVFVEPVVQVYAFIRDNTHLWVKDVTHEPS